MKIESTSHHTPATRPAYGRRSSPCFSLPVLTFILAFHTYLGGIWIPLATARQPTCSCRTPSGSHCCVATIHALDSIIPARISFTLWLRESFCFAISSASRHLPKPLSSLP